MDVLTGDIHSDEVSCFGVEPECVGPPAAAGAHFAFVCKEPFRNQLSNEFCDRWNADGKVLAEICYAAVTILDAKLYYSFLNRRHKS